MVQSPTETPSFEEIIIKVTDEFNEGKDINEIQTGFCIEEIDVLEEESAQIQLKNLINQVCESRGTEQIIDEEFLKPQTEAHRPDLLQCFVSVLEKFSIQKSEIIIFLKESSTLKDVALEEEKVDIRPSNYKYSDSMTAYKVSSDQLLNTTTALSESTEGIKMISENVTSLENISMVSFILINSIAI